MDSLGALLDRLPLKHRKALGWFLDNTGQVVSWPKPVNIDGEQVDLAVTAMGIYKPKWSHCALSVWQSLRGAYPDQPPIKRQDGSWVYAYYQQNQDPDKRDSFFTNRGLMQCMADRVPIGVFRQVKAKPSPRYEVLGIAMVSNWDGGFFYLDGVTQDRRAHPRGPEAQLDFYRGLFDDRKKEIGILDPTNMIDARKRVLTTIIQREGQSDFRTRLLSAYENRCAFTGYDAPRALDAAHIVPYQGSRTNHVSNGLLLRGDIHTLFDVGLVGVDESKMKLLVKDELRSTEYRALAGSAIALPHDIALLPSKQLLEHHRKWAGFV